MLIRRPLLRRPENGSYLRRKQLLQRQCSIEMILGSSSGKVNGCDGIPIENGGWQVNPASLLSFTVPITRQNISNREQKNNFVTPEKKPKSCQDKRIGQPGYQATKPIRAFGPMHAEYARKLYHSSLQNHQPSLVPRYSSNQLSTNCKLLQAQSETKGVKSLQKNTSYTEVAPKKLHNQKEKRFPCKFQPTVPNIPMFRIASISPRPDKTQKNNRNVTTTSRTRLEKENSFQTTRIKEEKDFSFASIFQFLCENTHR